MIVYVYKPPLNTESCPHTYNIHDCASLRYRQCTHGKDIEQIYFIDYVLVRIETLLTSPALNARNIEYYVDVHRSIKLMAIL